MNRGHSIGYASASASYNRNCRKFFFGGGSPLESNAYLSIACFACCVRRHIRCWDRPFALHIQTLQKLLCLHQGQFWDFFYWYSCDYCSCRIQSFLHTLSHNLFGETWGAMTTWQYFWPTQCICGRGVQNIQYLPDRQELHSFGWEISVQ